MNSCIGALAEDVAIPHLQNILAYVLAQDSGLRSFGVRSNMSQTIVRHLQTQLKTILRDHCDIIFKHRWFSVFPVKEQGSH